MSRFRDWPWAVKLAVVMVGLALLPIAIVTTFTEVTARRDFIRDSGARNLQQATNTAGLLASYLEDVLGDITDPGAIARRRRGAADRDPEIRRGSPR